MALIGGSSSSSSSLSIQKEQNLNLADYSDGDGARSTLTIGQAKNISGGITTTDHDSVNRAFDLAEGQTASFFHGVENVIEGVLGFAAQNNESTTDLVRSAGEGAIAYQDKALHQVAKANESATSKENRTLVLLVLGTVGVVGVVMAAKALKG